MPPIITDPPEKLNRREISERRWIPTGVSDLRVIGREPGHCDFCNRNDLRYLHSIEDEYGNALYVGCECASHLCFGYDAKLTERNLRSWMTRRWRQSRAGNPYVIVEENRRRIVVTIYPHHYLDDRFNYSIVTGRNSKPEFSPDSYQGEDNAKYAAFNRVAELLGWGGNDASA